MQSVFNVNGADNGNRTRLSSLGSWHSTDELYPHIGMAGYKAACRRLEKGGVKNDSYVELVNGLEPLTC